ncbi:MAG: hypothetical protein HY647_13775, partial [Acidobacteria bacterium]|nr:hypothetical protein [Acidobacteriota bacterium]
MLGYAILLLLFLGFFSLSLWFGLKEWLYPEDASPLPVDVDYVRVENYFGAAFREKLRAVGETAPSRLPTQLLKSSAEVVSENSWGEASLIFPDGRLGDGQGHEPVVYCEGNLALASGSTSRQEVYCRGDFKTAAGVELQAVAADGAVTLGAGSRVEKWVDAQGKTLLRSGTIVGDRVSSSVSIEMERGVSVRSLYAPRIFTAGYVPDLQTDKSMESEGHTHPVPPGTPRTLPPCLQGVSCFPLAPDTFLVPGDLLLNSGSLVDAHLVVEGTLRSGPECAFRGHVKARAVQLGARNRIGGNLISEGAVEIGEKSFVRQCVVAATDLRLRAGARVGRPHAQAAVSAGGEITLDENVE